MRKIFLLLRIFLFFGQDVFWFQENVYEGRGRVAEAFFSVVTFLSETKTNNLTERKKLHCRGVRRVLQRGSGYMF